MGVPVLELCVKWVLDHAQAADGTSRREDYMGCGFTIMGFLVEATSTLENMNRRRDGNFKCHLTCARGA